MLGVTAVLSLGIRAVNINKDPTLHVSEFEFLTSNIVQSSLPDVKLHVLPTLAQILLQPVLRVELGVLTAVHVDVLRETKSVVARPITDIYLRSKVFRKYINKVMK